MGGAAHWTLVRPIEGAAPGSIKIQLQSQLSMINFTGRTRRGAATRGRTRRTRAQAAAECDELVVIGA